MKRFLVVACLLMSGPGCSSIFDFYDPDDVDTPRRANESESVWRTRAAEEENIHDTIRDFDAGE